MKVNHNKKQLKKLTFGDYILKAYKTSTRQTAGRLVKLAVNTRVIVFPEYQRYIVS